MGQIKANHGGEFYNEGYWMPQALNFNFNLNTSPSINKDGKAKYAQYILRPPNRNLFIYKIKNKIINLELIFSCSKNKKNPDRKYND